MKNYFAIVGLALMAGSAAAADAPVTAGATRYVQGTAGSTLAFTFTQLGAASTGHFKTFVTDFQYDPANPTRSSLLVKVTIDSLDTQDAERDDTLKTPDLFDAKTWPAATYVARSLVRTASGGFEAVGRLTIRDIGKDLRLPLTIKPTAGGLELSGQTTIKRLDFGVGQGEWQSTESISDDVKLVYKVVLVKAAT